MAANLCRVARTFHSYVWIVPKIRCCRRYLSCPKARGRTIQLQKYFSTEEQPYTGMLRRLWNWFNTYYEEPEISPEEQKERDALLEKLHVMTYATPPIQPDLSFFREAFDTLIKYNDRVGVNILWKILMDMDLEPDDELEEKVDSYLERANKEAAWYE